MTGNGQRRLVPSPRMISDDSSGAGVTASVTRWGHRWRLSTGPWSLWLLAATLPLSLVWIALIAQGSVAFDWRIFAEASDRVRTGELYAVTDTYAYRYSPLLAYLLGPLTALGPWAWRAAIVLSALALPTWPMRLAVLVSWPFWFDVQHGGTMTFALLAAAWALRDHKAAVVAYLALVLLIPRPLFLPVAAWVLWREPWVRAPFAGMAAAAVLGALATGYADEWIGRLLASSDEMGSLWNLGPSRLIGAAWLAIGVPLAAWLTWKGRVGLASLAFSPYLLPYYFLFGLLGFENGDVHGIVPRVGGRSDALAEPLPTVGPA